MLSGVRLLSFKQIGDERGHLVVVEGEGADVPFDVKRLFYIYGSDSTVVRGKHANRKSEFVLINLTGKSKVRIVDTSGQSIVVELNEPHIGVYIPKMVWKEMFDFSEDSMLLCLASEHYDDAEYIRDFSEYVKVMENENDKKN